MVVELTQESFQTGKAIVTVSVDLITAIEDACKRCAAYSRDPYWGGHCPVNIFRLQGHK